MTHHDASQHEAINYIEIHNGTGRPIVVRVRQSCHTAQMRLSIDEISPAPEGTEIEPNRVTYAPVYPGLP